MDATSEGTDDAGATPGTGGAAGADGAGASLRDGSLGGADIPDAGSSVDGRPGSGLAADGPTGALDAAPARPAGTDASSAACNDLPLVAADVTPMVSVMALPAELRPAGGAIRDGSYALTSLRIYSASEPARYGLLRFGALLRVSGNATRTDLSFRSSIPSLGEEKENLSSAEISAAGTTLTTRALCPERGRRETSGYTATAETITLFRDDRGETAISTYTRR